MFKVLFVLAASLCVAYAALSLARLEEKPEKFKGQEGCYIKDLDAVIPFGGSAPSKSSCKEYRCRENNVQIATCGVVQESPGCKLESDLTKPYPDCCPKVVCA